MCVSFLFLFLTSSSKLKSIKLEAWSISMTNFLLFASFWSRKDWFFNNFFNSNSWIDVVVAVVAVVDVVDVVDVAGVLDAINVAELEFVLLSTGIWLCFSVFVSPLVSPSWISWISFDIFIFFVWFFSFFSFLSWFILFFSFSNFINVNFNSLILFIKFCLDLSCCTRALPVSSSSSKTRKTRWMSPRTGESYFTFGSGCKGHHISTSVCFALSIIFVHNFNDNCPKLSCCVSVSWSHKCTCNVSSSTYLVCSIGKYMLSSFHLGYNVRLM